MPPPTHIHLYRPHCPPTAPRVPLFTLLASPPAHPRHRLHPPLHPYCTQICRPFTSPRPPEQLASPLPNLSHIPPPSSPTPTAPPCHPNAPTPPPPADAPPCPCPTTVAASATTSRQRSPFSSRFPCRCPLRSAPRARSCVLQWTPFSFNRRAPRLCWPGWPGSAPPPSASPTSKGAVTVSLAPHESACVWWDGRVDVWQIVTVY